MSHFPERNEKICLNCGSLLYGRYCHECGQENIEPKESFWHLVTHFIYDVTHFDGKFFSTLKYLLFRPGFLSKEYFKGRRSGYLHPVKMYVFTSALFFLIFFGFYSQHNPFNYTESKKDLADTLRTVSQPGGHSSMSYRSVRQYDSVQNTLPEAKKDDWGTRQMMRRSITLNEKYHNDPKAIVTVLGEKFTHLFPQMLFVSLPLFALALSLLYVRRKQFYYVNHVVFTVHLYCAIFIMILGALLLGSFSGLFHWHLNGVLTGIASLLILFYGYVAMRRFYSQSPGKTFLKYSLVLLLGFAIMIFIFMIFGAFSMFTI